MQDKTGKSPKKASESALKHAYTKQGESEISENVQGQEEQRASINEEEAEETIEPADIFRGLAGTTSRVVQQAASILEEEIAAGIIAAKQVEKRFMDPDSPRSKKSDALIQRLRSDLHEVVDIILDLISTATEYVGGFGQQIVISGDEDRKRTDYRISEHLSTLTTPNPVDPGELVELTMVLENGKEESTDEFSFHSTDLVSTCGGRIPAERIAFKPSFVVVGPRATEKIGIFVDVPEEIPAGVYSGLIQSTNTEKLRAVLVVQVG